MTKKAAIISKNNFNKASKSSATYYRREHQVEYTLNWKYEPCCDCFGFLKKYQFIRFVFSFNNETLFCKSTWLLYNTNIYSIYSNSCFVLGFVLD